MHITEVMLDTAVRIHFCVEVRRRCHGKVNAVILDFAHILRVTQNHSLRSLSALDNQITSRLFFAAASGFALFFDYPNVRHVKPVLPAAALSCGNLSITYERVDVPHLHTKIRGCLCRGNIRPRAVIAHCVKYTGKEPDRQDLAAA